MSNKEEFEYVSPTVQYINKNPELPNQPSGYPQPGAYNYQSQSGGGGYSIGFSEQGNYNSQPSQQQPYPGYAPSGVAYPSGGNSYAPSGPAGYSSSQGSGYPSQQPPYGGHQPQPPSQYPGFNSQQPPTQYNPSPPFHDTFQSSNAPTPGNYHHQPLELSNAPCDNYPQVNLLVLGVTGVGKSTWINAIANYITYETLAEAEDNPLINLIPTQFDMTVNRNGELDVQRFRIGVSENESYDKEGQACTQFPRPYTFTHNGTLYRIIDTPGIADPRGLDQDKINMENVMRFIARYDVIHAICILMMPNECKLTAQFEFCFKELLMQFHRSAVNNIVFCFTNTSGYDFQVSGTLVPLRALINEIKKLRQVEFTISNDKCYPFDNMAYRYLCATQPEFNFQFTDDQKAVYGKAYDISRATTDRLLQYVLTQKPHNAKESMSVYHSRNLIIRLTRPLARINECVQLTVQKIKDREEQIAACGNDYDALQKVLNKKITKVHWRIDTTEYNVCATKTCTYKTQYWGKDREQFMDIEPTAMDKDPFELISYPKTLTKVDGVWNCPVCGPPPTCTPYTDSRWFAQYTEEEDEEDTTVASQMKNKKKSKEEMEQQIWDEKRLHSEILNEQQQILKATAKFAVFLTHHSITPYNDATKKHLELQIELAQQVNNRVKVKGYTELLNRYNEEVRILQNAMNRASSDKGSPVETAAILDLVNELQKMKHYGRDVVDALKMINTNSQNDLGHADRHFTVDNQHSRSSKGKKGGRLLDMITDAAQKRFNLN